MSELGIFIDESGIFEANKSQDGDLKDLYIVAFLFHDKSVQVDNDIQLMEQILIDNGFDSEMPIHTMPLIRGKDEFSQFSRDKRQKIFQILFQFMRKLKLKHKTFVCDKKYCSTKQIIRKYLEKNISQMIIENYDYLSRFNEIVIYYDEGQDYLTRILHDVFSKTLKKYRFKENVSPSNYRLVQCADLVCSLELIKQRKQNNEHINAIEKFFKSDGNFNQNYKKAYDNLEL